MKKDIDEVVQYIYDYLAGTVQTSLSVDDGGIASIAFDDEDESFNDIAEVLVNNYSSDYIDTHVENFYAYQENDIIPKRDIKDLKDKDVRLMAVETFNAFKEMINSSFKAATEVVEENKFAIINQLSSYISMEKIPLVDEEETSTMKL